MKGRLVFFSGIYDTLDLYTKKFIRIFTERDYECLNLDVSDMQRALAALSVFLEEGPITAAIGFNGMGFLLEPMEGHNIWEETGAKAINILMDHPFHFDKHLSRAPKTAVILCMDRRHVGYVRRFYPGIREVGFLPHAGLDAEEEGKPGDIGGRSIEVLYAGTLSRFGAEGLVPDLSMIREYDALRLSKEVLEELTSCPEKTTEEAIEAWFLHNGIHFPDEALLRQIIRLRFLDSFAVSFYREQAVGRLLGAGIPVTVYGAGWDQAGFADHPKLDFRGRAAAPDIPLIMRDSKITLNTMTWFKAGTHDRVFNGMLARSGVVTDDSEYMRERFTSGKELKMFSLRRIEEMPGMVEELLTHPKELQEMADRGMEEAAENDTWENRVDEILIRYL